MLALTINASLQPDYCEIDLLSTAVDFTRLAACLARLESGRFALTRACSPYYPISVEWLTVEVVNNSNGLITAHLTNLDFKLWGDAQSFRKAAGFLASLVNAAPGEHFHLDWFADPNLLAPATSTMSFIFNVAA